MIRGDQGDETLAVAHALSAGWRAVRVRPGVMLAYGGVLVVQVLAVWVIGGLAAATSDVVWVGRFLALVALFVALTAGMFAVGYALMWLRVVRGDPANVGDYLIGWRRLPALVAAGSTALAIVIAAGAVVVLGGALPYALGVIVFDSILPVGTIATGMFTAFLSALSAATIGIAAVVAVYVVAGISQWPFLVADAGLGGLEAIRASWTMMRGQRLAVTSLFFATLALWTLGSLAFGIGAILTLSVAVAAHAALYERLASAPTSPEPRALPRTVSSIAVDAVLVTWLVATVLIVVLAAGTAPIVEWVKAEWPPYGTRLLVIPIVLPGLLSLLLYAAYGVRRASPGRRIVGAGWGRSGWIAVGLLLFPLGLAGAVQTARASIGGINAIAVGQEMGRVVTAALPRGYERSLDQGGSEDWFRIMDVVDGEETGFVSVYYTVIDSGGTPYHFRLATYTRPETAQVAYGRLGGKFPPPDDAAPTEPDQVPPGLARRAAVGGNTVLAGEGPASHEVELEAVMQLQVDRIHAAREHVAPVFDGLPQEPQRLRHSTP